ncbi:redoxin domain-containing protein [Stakelama sp. CBK3Z-3]|uniref:Redoxin domain-containing protein n=1 Tax=Stakelama flava TaxID=2860338 RepID=A0ABS6XHW1_9SPHN|nr:redoxin domain-containing protein [Stakelama flava]MBW4329771.1 redoxin domain-containing protein [Stakelama flava]
MNRTRIFAAATAAVAAFVAGPIAAQQTVGQQARNFRLTDMHGKNVELADYRGKIVVLEWNNPGCPFVQKHYRSGNMQNTQVKAREMGAVWLTINSGAPGKQGNMTGAQAQRFVADQKAKPTDYLLDPKGVVGKAYDAKTTPHLYIIAADGTLVYQGGMDDRPTADPADIDGARNHVIAALRELSAGQPVSVSETRPYGCSVKYAS